MTHKRQITFRDDQIEWLDNLADKIPNLFSADIVRFAVDYVRNTDEWTLRDLIEYVREDERWPERAQRGLP